jgi:Rieske Fe-S protein
METVEVAPGELPAPGAAAPFKAWVAAPGTAAGELLLRGTLWRLESGSFDVWSVLCPHEICEVERISDPAALAQHVSVALPRRPLLACPCHFSVFDPEARGARLAGPAPRGLYRFGFEVAGDRVRIDRIENALIERFTHPEPKLEGEPR